VDDVRLAAVLDSAAETERAIRFHLDHDEGSLEQHHGLTAYRYAVGLRKALAGWSEMRVARRAQPMKAD